VLRSSPRGRARGVIAAESRTVRQRSAESALDRLPARSDTPLPSCDVSREAVRVVGKNRVTSGKRAALWSPDDGTEHTAVGVGRASLPLRDSRAGVRRGCGGAAASVPMQACRPRCRPLPLLARATVLDVASAFGRNQVSRLCGARASFQLNAIVRTEALPSAKGGVRRPWTCPVFDDTWTLPVQSRGKSRARCLPCAGSAPFGGSRDLREYRCSRVSSSGQ
jgi:hypothetical protein